MTTRGGTLTEFLDSHPDSADLQRAYEAAG